MTRRSPQFSAIFDQQRFPLLTAGGDLPATHLMGCKELTFFSPENLEQVTAVILREPLKWHQYGDARWPSMSSWIEIETRAGGYPGSTGILVVCYPVPDNAPDPLRWVAEHGPLTELFPEERGDAMILRKTATLRQQAAYLDPDDEGDATPRFVQSYCVYRADDDVTIMATYTDLLNGTGVPIPRFRMASLQEDVTSLCRFALHALFRMNQARLAGMRFMIEGQLQHFGPVRLAPGEVDSPWARFHPSRVLRTRPMVRAIPSPRNMVKGIMPLEAFEAVTEARRKESNLHMLAFARDERPRSASYNDTNATMAAFSHSANGGAIYQLPDALVEEFNYTDCDEVRVGDIRLPFTNVFLKFTPPEPLSLDDGALVDGCYVVKQGNEYLLSLTSRWTAVDYSSSLSVACIDPAFSIHLPARGEDSENSEEREGLRINEAVERGVQEFLEKNAPPPENQSRVITPPDGTTTFVEDIRALSRARRIAVFRSQEPVFRACLNIIVNAACFISFRPEDISEEWDGNPPAWVIDALSDPRDTRSARDRKQHAQRVLSTGDFTRVRICGKALFRDRSPAEPAMGQGASPRAHWRRGHWRRQRHGVGLMMVTPRWIRPTLVKRDNGQVVETRLYDVQNEPPLAGEQP